MEDANEFSIDVETVLEGSTSQAAKASPHRAGMRLLVIDPSHTDSRLLKLLEAAGFACSRVETGSQAVEAVAAGQFSALICVASGDDDWRRFLAANIKHKFDHFPVLFTAQTPTESEHQRLLGFGADAVIPTGLSSPAALGELLDNTLGIRPRQEAPMDTITELALLKRRLHDAEDAQRSKDREIDDLKGRFLRAIDEAAQRTSESTGLRSEVSILRDRASVMKQRLQRAMVQIEHLKVENARLTGDSSPTIAPSFDPQTQQLLELQSLLAALLPFQQSTEQAVSFLEELSIAAGPRAGLLTRHLHQLRLLSDVFQRIRMRLGTK